MIRILSWKDGYGNKVTKENERWWKLRGKWLRRSSSELETTVVYSNRWLSVLLWISDGKWSLLVFNRLEFFIHWRILIIFVEWSHWWILAWGKRKRIAPNHSVSSSFHSRATKSSQVNRYLMKLAKWAKVRRCSSGKGKEVFIGLNVSGHHSIYRMSATTDEERKEWIRALRFGSQNELPKHRST